MEIESGDSDDEEALQRVRNYKDLQRFVGMQQPFLKELDVSLSESKASSEDNSLILDAGDGGRTNSPTAPVLGSVGESEQETGVTHDSPSELSSLTELYRAHSQLLIPSYHASRVPTQHSNTKYFSSTDKATSRDNPRISENGLGNSGGPTIYTQLRMSSNNLAALPVRGAPKPMSHSRPTSKAKRSRSSTAFGSLAGADGAVPAGSVLVTSPMLFSEWESREGVDGRERKQQRNVPHMSCTGGRPLHQPKLVPNPRKMVDTWAVSDPTVQVLAYDGISITLTSCFIQHIPFLCMTTCLCAPN